MKINWFPFQQKTSKQPDIEPARARMALKSLSAFGGKVTASFGQYRVLNCLR
jgi:hypothetical protein